MLVILGLAQSATAQQADQRVGQQAESMSPSVVLVLKLVSNTHVKPTTGIVISDEGLVLVPAEFASGEGEMIVLDGGTDILSNGRPAQIHALTSAGDLAILFVQGLKRPGITLSDNAQESGSTNHLEAFPPAEYIAKGAQPLWVPLNVVPGTVPAVSSETPLPYVSGAIIDACGYLAGISLSSGPQSLESIKKPKTLFKDQLKPVFEQMQITLPSASCTISAQVEETPVITTDNESPVVEPVVEPAESEQSEPESKEPEPVEPALVEPLPAEDSSGSLIEPRVAPEQPVNTRASEPPSIWRSVPVWLPLLGIIILGVLIWKAIFFFRLSKSTPEHETASASANKIQPASDEPDTAPLDVIADENVAKPRSAPVFDFDIPNSDKRPDGCDAVLVIEGLLDAETEFRRFCFINSKQINVIIGRGDTDIAIEHPAISRRHVRIESDKELLTISDLGSRNGTFIGDVPCLAGEILYFESGDELFLGDVKLTVRIVKQEAEWA